MEKHEIEMLEKLSQTNPELKELWDEHLLYSKQVSKLEGKSFRTPTEEQTLKQLKKQKLEGKTSLVDLLEKHMSGDK